MLTVSQIRSRILPTDSLTVAARKRLLTEPRPLGSRWCHAGRIRDRINEMVYLGSKAHSIARQAGSSETAPFGGCSAAGRPQKTMVCPTGTGDSRDSLSEQYWAEGLFHNGE